MRHVMTRAPYNYGLADDTNHKRYTEPLIQSSSTRYSTAASAGSEYKDLAPDFDDPDGQSLDEQNGPTSTRNRAWLNHVLNLGYAGRTMPSKVRAIPLEIDHQSCLSRFRRAWHARRDCSGYWQVYKVLYDTCGPMLRKSIALALVSTMLEFLSLIFVHQLIAYVEAEDLNSSYGAAFSDDASNTSDGRHSTGTKPLAEGLLWVSLLGVSLATNSFLRAHAAYWMKLGSLIMQNALSAAIIDKVSACKYVLVGTI